MKCPSCSRSHRKRSGVRCTQLYSHYRHRFGPKKASRSFLLGAIAGGAGLSSRRCSSSP